MRMTRRTQRGLGLIDALVALAVLSIGLLGLARFQSRTVAATTDGQQRLVALQQAERLVSQVLVDKANARCYVVGTSVPSDCVGTNARVAVERWQTDLGRVLPSPFSQATLDAPTQQFRVRIQWNNRPESERRTVEVTTDVR